MEEGEIDEEEEKAKTAIWEAEKQAGNWRRRKGERAGESAEKQKQEKAASEKLEEKAKQSPSILSPPSSAPIVASASALLDDSLPEPQQPPLDLETRTTILIPNGFIPTEKPLRPRIWGGGGFDPNPHPRPPLPMRSRSGRKGKVGASANGKRTRPPLSAKTSHNANSADPSSASGSITLNGKPRQQSMRSRRTRRVYTDDSDVFLCAVHSGWLTWSGARKARARGRDLRIEVRVLRCAGTGLIVSSLAEPVRGATRAPGDPEIVREEIVGRFVGGYGEKCLTHLGRAGE
ncbi:hypothetical protein BJ912DRAFT_442004 [Pholiota molesta]|nr:hypothetical protein BJ912DRAFT_442004 [Pholiota molesta]